MQNSQSISRRLYFFNYRNDMLEFIEIKYKSVKFNLKFKFRSNFAMRVEIS